MTKYLPILKRRVYRSPNIPPRIYRSQRIPFLVHVFKQIASGGWNISSNNETSWIFRSMSPQTQDRSRQWPVELSVHSIHHLRTFIARLGLNNLVAVTVKMIVSSASLMIVFAIREPFLYMISVELQGTQCHCEAKRDLPE